MSINKIGTARLYIGGEYIADVNIDNLPQSKEAIIQYEKDENLGRLLWKLDGVKVNKKAICIGLTGYDPTKLQVSIGNMDLYNALNNNKNEYNNKNHFAKYIGQRKGKHGVKKWNINRKNY